MQIGLPQSLRTAANSQVLRWLAAITSLTIAVCVIGHAWYWHRGISAIEQNIAIWADSIRAQGGRVAFGDLSFGGYPLSFVVHAKSVEIESNSTQPGKSGVDWSWRGGSVHVWARVWNPAIIFAQFAGGHSWHGASESGDEWLNLKIEQTVTTVTLLRGELRRLSLELSDVQVASNLLLGAVTTEAASLSADLNRESVGSPRVHIAGRARHTRLPLSNTFPLGTTVDQLSWKLTSNAPLPPSVTLPAIKSWRDDGGSMEVEAISLRWGALTVDAQGTLSLDKKYRPLAALSATVRGHRAIVDSFVQAGTIRPAEGAAAKIALSVFSNSAENGGIELPLTAQDGWLTAGPLRLFRLHSLEPLIASASLL